ncbi:hypothetical protein [Sphingobacterium sp. 2149]|uniref:hypothetical protein n=1 Tax=Sphingobacterium sp. 2149 TaxID=2817763 RepID=UPI0028636140|nr:hypothetical protein [Sphingobacterium sp. 2149]MDR6736601.1 hypothetical protein [Sphingobacterium sp. 2149]
MIIDNSFNRDKIRSYLENISEDNLIDEIIILLFSKNGYYVYRKNIHGPGEHGKDIIFYRRVSLFRDDEFIVVQAKAEKCTAGNISKFAAQINRAHKVPVGGKANSNILPNYVMFINSKIHSNDADFEMHYLTEVKVNTKILTQDHLIDLIIEYQIVPNILGSELESYTKQQDDSYDDKVRNIILGEDNKAINKLLDHDLQVDSRELSDDLKGTIINYIFKKWDEDNSWSGTVKPMGWLNYYFDFIQPYQYNKLFRVFEEYVARYPSRYAAHDTFQVLNKISPEQINAFKEKFLGLVARQVKDNSDTNHILRKKLNELIKSGYTQNTEKIVSLTIRIFELRDSILSSEGDENLEGLRTEYREKIIELDKLLYPEPSDN